LIFDSKDFPFVHELLALAAILTGRSRVPADGTNPKARLSQSARRRFCLRFTRG
jgi:hypothetical protein